VQVIGERPTEAEHTVFHLVRPREQGPEFSPFVALYLRMKQIIAFQIQLMSFKRSRPDNFQITNYRS
jgi:hypothetical protein